MRFCLAGEYPLDITRIGGGVLNVVYVLGQTFAESEDIDFHIVTPAKGLSSVETVERPGVTIHYVGSPKHRVIPRLLTQNRKLASVLRELSPDIVNSHHCVTTRACVAAGVKVVHTVHGVIHREVRFARGRNVASTILHAALEKKAVAEADAVIGVADYVLNEYSPWIAGPSARIDVPIEDVFFRDPGPARGKGVLFVGGICARKNLAALVRAMMAVVERHPDAVLSVCGGIVQRRYFNELVASIKHNGIEGNIRFLGVVSREEVARLLGESACLVLPSWQESAPAVVFQCMAAGRVPISSPVGGIPEVIEDGVTGFIVEPEDSDSLAERITRLLDEPELVGRMGKAGREAAVRYERHAVARRILDVCSSLVVDQKG